MSEPSEPPPRSQPAESAAGFRSGFCCFVGRPNAGKSTLTNALVGQKIAITSSKPQTTRHAARGILHRPDAQLIIVDTPGLHRPRTLLGQRLNDVVATTLSDVDVIGFCLPANEKIGPGDRYIAAQLAALNTPVIAIVTKLDLIAHKKVAEHLLAVSGLGEFVDIIPVSATAGEQVDLLADLLIAQLPLGPPLYPADVRTDESTETMITELIREAALEGVRDELPHSIAVTISEMLPRADNPELLDIYATIHVERDSQKGIVIGPGGSRLKAIGVTSRPAIEELVGGRVYLNLHIAVMADWQRDPKKLDRLGF